MKKHSTDYKLKRFTIIGSIILVTLGIIYFLAHGIFKTIMMIIVLTACVVFCVRIYLGDKKRTKEEFEALGKAKDQWGK